MGYPFVKGINSQMSMDQWDAEQEAGYERLYLELGPQWAAEHRDELFEQAIQEFTADRLKSYYVAHPNLAKPAFDSLNDARSLRPLHPKAALIFAATATELGIKVVLLQPIVFGLVHTDRLAELITDLATQHTGTDRFQALLAEILKHYGGVNLKTFTRPGSTKSLWQEIKDIQTVRNGVIHRGELLDDTSAELGIAVAATILQVLFPQVLCKLGLHLHDPLVVCGQRHTTTLPAMFTIPGHLLRTMTASVELNLPELDLSSPPETVSGEVTTYVDESDLAAMRSAPSDAYMRIVSVPLRYQVCFEFDSTRFFGTKTA
jgi:hypothetical protein